MGRKGMDGLVKRSVDITERHRNYLAKNHINLSAVIREYLDELIDGKK